jgi:hypothetical protein
MKIGDWKWLSPLNVLCSQGLSGVIEAVEVRSKSKERNTWRRVRAAFVVIGLVVSLSGCGLFGCGAAGSNGAFLGGCAVGTRF